MTPFLPAFATPSTPDAAPPSGTRAARPGEVPSGTGAEGPPSPDFLTVFAQSGTAPQSFTLMQPAAGMGHGDTPDAAASQDKGETVPTKVGGDGWTEGTTSPGDPSAPTTNSPSPPRIETAGAVLWAAPPAWTDPVDIAMHRQTPREATVLDPTSGAPPEIVSNLAETAVSPRQHAPVALARAERSASSSQPMSGPLPSPSPGVAPIADAQPGTPLLARTDPIPGPPGGSPAARPSAHADPSPRDGLHIGKAPAPDTPTPGLHGAARAPAPEAVAAPPYGMPPAQAASDLTAPEAPAHPAPAGTEGRPAPLAPSHGPASAGGTQPQPRPILTAFRDQAAAPSAAGPPGPIPLPPGLHPSPVPALQQTTPVPVGAPPPAIAAPSVPAPPQTAASTTGQDMVAIRTDLLPRVFPGAAALPIQPIDMSPTPHSRAPTPSMALPITPTPASAPTRAAAAPASPLPPLDVPLRLEWAASSGTPPPLSMTPSTPLLAAAPNSLQTEMAPLPAMASPPPQGPGLGPVPQAQATPVPVLPPAVPSSAVPMPGADAADTAFVPTDLPSAPDVPTERITAPVRLPPGPSPFAQVMSDLPHISLPRGEGMAGQPATAAPASGPPTTLPDLVGRQIVPNLAASGPVLVTLAPVELGKLHFEVTPRGDGLHLHLVVDSPTTLDLLRRQGDQMLAELRQAGFPHCSLSFAASDGQSGGPSGGQSGTRSDDRSQNESHGPPPDPPHSRDAPQRPLTPGTLDLRL